MRVSVSERFRLLCGQICSQIDPSRLVVSEEVNSRVQVEQMLAVLFLV